MTPGVKPTNEPKGSGRYEPLTRYLKGQDAGTVTLTLGQLGDILGFRLPAAASNHIEWWKEGGSRPQARGWLDAGWSFVRTDRRAQTVTFRRDAPTAGGRRGGETKRTKAPAAAAKRRAARTTAAVNAAPGPERRLRSGLILLPDSPHMKGGGDPTWRRQSTALALLGDAGARLAEARRTLADLVGEAAGPDLGGDGNRRAYLPALERFDGALHEAAVASSRSAEDRETMRRSCLIVSGLYGLLTISEPIREYSVTMETPLPAGLTVGRWWREHGLGEALRAYLSRSGVTDVYCFLSADGIAALDRLELEGTTVHEVAYAPGSAAPAEQGHALARLVKEGVCACASCNPVSTSAE